MPRGKPITIRSVVALMALGALAAMIVSCASDGPLTPKEKYGLTDEEAAAWDRFYLSEAESLATVTWDHIGRGEIDALMLLVQRFDDRKMKEVFKQRAERIWMPMRNWPADQLLKEPQIGLGDGHTVGFNTWSELWTSGFQRAVLADDSITVYFVFKGHWETERYPVYAAVACGDFGEEQVNWRPFSHIVFSVDESEETVRARGQAYLAKNLDDFVGYLRTRTFGSFTL